METEGERAGAVARAAASLAERARGRLPWLLLLPIVALAATRELWAPDEPRYAEIARELWETKSFLVLHLCGELYPDKPPLVYWLAALAGAIGGWSELALRVPSILATAGTAWLCARLARRFWTEREAAWVIAFYLGTLMVTWLGGRLALDPVLSFFCLASLVLATEPARGASKAVSNLALAGLALGLAALAKGPVAWLHVGLALAAWRFVPAPHRISLARPARGWVAFGALAVAPVLAWATFASLADERLWRPLFFGQHLGRLGESRAAHHGPIWYHLEDQSALLVPWTFLLVAAMSAAWRSVRARADLATAGVVRLAAWFALAFLVFSLIPPKRELYLLPIYPAAALLCARALAEAERARRLPGWVAVPTVAVVALVGTALAATPALVRALAARDPDRMRVFVEDATAAEPSLVLAGLLALSGAIVAFRAWRRARIALFATAMFTGMAAAETVVALAVVPRVNAHSSARELALALAARPEKPASIPCVGIHPEAFWFYARLPTLRGGLFAALEREGEDFLALIDPRDYARLAEEERLLFCVIDLGLDRQREVLVLGRATTER